MLSVLALLVHAVATSSAYPMGDTLISYITKHVLLSSNSTNKESINARYFINERYPPDEFHIGEGTTLIDYLVFVHDIENRYKYYTGFSIFFPLYLFL